MFVVNITVLLLSYFAIVGSEEVELNLHKYTNHPDRFPGIVACYVAMWAVYRKQNAAFNLHNLNPKLCDHILLAYAHLDAENCTLVLFESWDDMVGGKNENRIAELKEKNLILKVSISMGGWVDGSIKYSQFVANPEKRRKFVKNIVPFLRDHKLDGLDIVWEYPSKRGGTPFDKIYYAEFLKELRSAFDEHNLILTAVIGSSKDTIDAAYDVPKLSKYLHRMHVNTFDYYGYWSRITGSNSAINGSNFLNIEYTISYLLKLGADPKKIILGIPFYGRSFVLADATSFDKNKPSLGQSIDQNVRFQGPYTEEEGYFGYNEICLELKNSSEKWDKYWDNRSSTPYIVSGDKIIVYDDVISIKEKVKFARENKLGGCFSYSIDTDDFMGDCADKNEQNATFPLLNTIKKEMINYFKEIYIEMGKLQPVELKSGNYAVKYNVLLYLYCLLCVLRYA